MPSKKASASKAAESSANTDNGRAQALAILQEAENNWWDSVEVTVPWAAISSTHAARTDTWVGIITDAAEM